MEDIAKNNFSLKACYLMPKSIFIICWKLWHSFFQFSCVLKTIPKNVDFWSCLMKYLRPGPAVSER